MRAPAQHPGLGDDPTRRGGRLRGDPGPGQEGPGPGAPAPRRGAGRLRAAARQGGRHRPVDFEKAVRDDGSPDARRVLEADGLVAGCQRLWTRDEGGTIIGFVYRFSAPNGAEHYRDRTLASLREETEGARVSEMSVPDVPGARGVRIVEDDEHTAVAFVTRDGLVGQVVVIGPDAATDAVPVALGRQQYERFGSPFRPACRPPGRFSSGRGRRPGRGRPATAAGRRAAGRSPRPTRTRRPGTHPPGRRRSAPTSCWGRR